MLKPFAPRPSIEYPLKLKAIVTDFDPSVLPVILPLVHGGADPDAALIPYSLFCEWIVTLCEPELDVQENTVVPSMVTLPDK